MKKFEKLHKTLAIILALTLFFNGCLDCSFRAQAMEFEDSGGGLSEGDSSIGEAESINNMDEEGSLGDEEGSSIWLEDPEPVPETLPSINPETPEIPEVPEIPETPDLPEQPDDPNYLQPEEENGSIGVPENWTNELEFPDYPDNENSLPEENNNMQNLYIPAVTITGESFQNGYYRSDVTAVVDDTDYEISFEADGNYGEFVTWTESQTNPIVYIRNKKNIDFNTIPVTLDSFVIDKEIPSFDIIEVSNFEEWSQLKTVRVSAFDSSNALFGIFYALEPIGIGAIEEGKIPSKLTKMEDGTLTITENIGEEEKTYYLYAIDMAGNISEERQVSVNKIDTEKPVISGFEESYFIGAGGKQVVFRAEDDASGIDISSATALDGEENSAQITLTEAGKYIVTFERSGEYQIEISDRAGNRSDTVYVQVQQDDVAPELILSKVQNDAGYHAKTEDNKYYFKDSLEVLFDIVDEAASDGETKSPVIIKKNSVEFKKGDNLEEFQDTIKESGTYVYTIEDGAGNRVEDSITIVAEKSQAIPEIQVSYAAEPVMVEENAYFGGELLKQFQICGQIKDTVGIAKVEYKMLGEDGEGDYKKIADFLESDGTYTALKNVTYEEILLSADNLPKDQDLQVKDGTYTYLFKVTNILGESKEEMLTFKVDCSTPEETIYVSYETDMAEKENSGIMDFFKTSLDKLFGKKAIRFHLYVKDGESPAASGIDLEDLKGRIFTVDQNANLKQIEAIEGSTADFTYQGTEYKGYTHIQGKIEVSGSLDFNGYQLRIEQIQDLAGNVLKEIRAQNITGTTVMYIDDVPPVLSVDYYDGIMDEKSSPARVFYGKDAHISLGLKESYYKVQTDTEDNIIAPEVTISGENTENVMVSDWTETTTDSQNYYDASAQIQFPCSSEEGELEYLFEVKYRDGSGNLLTTGDNCKGSIQDGVFQGYTIIVDNQAPKLTNFGISGEEVYDAEGVKVYRHQAGEDGDVTISFTIDDNYDYWKDNLKNLLFQIVDKADGRVIVSKQGDDGELRWEDDGRNHTAKYVFKGEENQSAQYQVVISYADMAKNLLCAGEGLDSQNGNFEEMGIYSSQTFILDHIAPKFDISYSEAKRLVRDADTNPLNDKLDSVPVVGYTAYYNADIDVKFAIDEQYALVENDGEKIVGLKDCVLKIDGLEKLPSINWTKEGNIIQGEFKIQDEGEYTVSIQYQDAASNKMEEQNAQGGIVEEGIYTSTTLVLDKTAPVVTTGYVTPSQERNHLEPKMTDQKTGRDFFAQTVYLEVTVDDKNIRSHELKETLKKLQVFDSAGNAIPNNSAEAAVEQLDNSLVKHDKTVYDIPLDTEANYDIPVAFEDLAGNKAILDTVLRSAVDKTKPEFTLSYDVSKSGFKDFINYKDFGYLFANSKMTLSVKAKDKIAGLHYIKYTITDENGKQEERVQTLDPSADSVFETAVKLDSPDFKGTVKMEVIDWAENTLDETRNCVVETESKHNSAGSAAITTYTVPGRTVGGVEYYNSDVKFHLSLKDTFSGLRDFEYTAGSAISKSMDYRKLAGTDRKEKPKTGITYEYAEDLILAASANNVNQVPVKASYTDNAGHIGKIEKFYNIDITAPVLDVVYDINSPVNETYYSQTRTATVTIKERNFSESDVKFTITNTDGSMPSISNWSTGKDEGDNTLHTCTISFNEDGDYSFAVSFEDLAGNKAEYNRVDEFTIDKTEPEIHVSYDNTNNINGNYFSKARTATIDILEHNFNESLIDVELTAAHSEEGAPSVSAFRRNGDHNVATVVFDSDGEYSLRISGKDLADNPMVEYESENFIIDQTLPRLEILDIEDMSANKGEVRPRIRYSDVNYDPKGTKITLKGNDNGAMEIKGDTTLIENGVEIRLDDFEHVAEMDDLYTMEVEISDLAGNRAETGISFSVNRFGSVYNFKEETFSAKKKGEKYYAQEEQDIVITETNVDTLKFKEITCNLNGNIRTLEENKDYRVIEKETDSKWKQYTYQIEKHNFEKEGLYILTIYSEDMAENSSDNSTKGKKIEFVVDKTKPSILVSGVENKKKYRGSNKEVTLDIDDNISLDRVEVELNGKKKVYSGTNLNALNGKIVLTIGSQNHWQNLKITAYDAAENSQIFGKIQFVVTSNIFVQLMMNPGLILGGIGAMTLLGAGTWWSIMTIRKRRKEQ